MDKKTDIYKPTDNEISDPYTVETFRSGRFVFQAGVDTGALTPLLDRVSDAHARFSSVPILPEVAASLEKEVMVSSVFGTNTIEGATLSEEETAEALARMDGPRDEQERRVMNLRTAYHVVKEYAQVLVDHHGEQGFALSVAEKDILSLHKNITDGLSHPNNVPGEYRDNQRGQRTEVGDAAHGGIYRPPKCKADIDLLMARFLDWINCDDIQSMSPLIRAPLTHYYFERIHPFWDGNGRVGRVLEALVLKCAGYEYAPYALSRFYYENIDEYYMVFNSARGAGAKKEAFPNTVFVELFLRGMLDVLNKLHDRVNDLIRILLYKTRVQEMFQRKAINPRQFQIINNLNWADLHNIRDVQAQTWYRALYTNLTPKTRTRDLKKLVEHKLIRVTPDREIRFLVP